MLNFSPRLPFPVNETFFFFFYLSNVWYSYSCHYARSLFVAFISILKSIRRKIPTRIIMRICTYKNGPVKRFYFFTKKKNKKKLRDRTRNRCLHARLGLNSLEIEKLSPYESLIATNRYVLQGLNGFFQVDRRCILVCY